MNCEGCEIIELKKKVLYQDKDVVVAIKDMVATPRQISIFSKEHFTILEMVPDDVIKKCSLIANKVGAAIFDSLDAGGTNLLINNGLGAGQKAPHFSMELIPRREDDGLKLEWNSGQLMEDEYEMAISVLKEEVNKIVSEDKASDKKSKGVKSIKEKQDGENYLVKSLKRKP